MPLNIAIDISPLNLKSHEISNGIARVTYQLIKYLVKDPRFTVTLYVSIADNFVDCKTFLSMDNLFSNLIVHKDISELNNINIYLSTFFDFPTLVKTNKNIRKYIIVYDLIFHKFPEYFEKEVNGPHYLHNVFKNLPLNTNVICISKSTMNDFLTFRPDFPKDKVFFSHLGVDSSFSLNFNDKKALQAKFQLNIPANEPYFITNSTIEIRKNIDKVIKSFFALCKKLGDNKCHLIIAGKKGWKFENINNAMSSSPEYKTLIHFTGYISDEELSLLYSGSLGFISMSSYEGFSLPPLEAMSSGCPVVIANNSSLPEVVGDAGIFVKTNSTKMLTSALEQLYFEKQIRLNLRIKGIEQAQKFSWDNFSTRITNRMINDHHKNNIFFNFISFISNIPLFQFSYDSHATHEQELKAVTEQKSITDQYLKNCIYALEESRDEFSIEINSNKEWPHSYAQSGEDVISSFIIRHFLGLSDFSLNYIDIGSGDPKDCNNSYFFYLRNGSGILVEPNRKSCIKTRTLRPRDIVINKGVSSSSGVNTYYSFGEKYKAFNTFSEARAKQVVNRGYSLEKQVKFQTISLNQIFRKYFKNKIIHFLSIDVEGTEYHILKSADFQFFRPWIICVESNITDISSVLDQKVVRLMIKNNYMLISHSAVNYIFIAKELFK